MEEAEAKVRMDLAEYGDQLLGLIPAERIRQVRFERPSAALIEGFKRLCDLTSTVADILDTFGYDTAIAASDLSPLRDDQRIVGPAVTIRHMAARVAPAFHLAQRKPPPQLGGRDQITLCERGDVMVIDARGIGPASSFGGLMATSMKSAGLEGLIVDGWVRDARTMRTLGLNVWARGTTPRTGKHRMELAEFNGPVEIAGVQIRPGDIMVGDSDGVIVVPLEVAAQVLEQATAATEREERLVAALESGASPRDAAAILPPTKW
ncbi:MAG: RraA family protein [Burkholderiales bacterium]|nr:RraA family protein [Burkholderiales bacterium]